jgi:hypothetical protein
MRSATVDMSAGTHSVRMEYFEAQGAALARLTWSRVDAAPATAATPAEAIGGPWRIQYYANSALRGEPTVVLADQAAALSYDWGLSSPTAQLPKDGFSASFTQVRAFSAGRYTFRTFSDDGVRLYVDDKLVIDSWYAMRGSRSVTLDLIEGNHSLRLDYFEQAGAARVQLTLQKL